ncbi:MAG: dihydrolipoyl dehydrogenase family protein [Gaiellaceae bacterium]|jgi:mercuric reductase
MNEHYDLIVLGAGSAARDAAGKAKRDYGANVAMVERERWGGSCPNIACRPTKAYLTAAELVHDVNVEAAGRGIRVSRAEIDVAQLREWKNSIRRDQDSWVEVLGTQYTTVAGEATFADARTVRVDGRDLTADRILIATGGRTAVPPIPGLRDVQWLDHISALELERVPESLLVLGGGPVGLEFAQIFARFGSRVTLVNHGTQIAARADTEAAAELAAALEDEGIEIVLTPGGVERFTRTPRGITAELTGGRMIVVSDVLLATGRVANVEALGLDAIGVDASPRGIGVDVHQRTSVDGIWAAGDAAAGPQLTPAAQYQARVAVDDMFGNVRDADYAVLPTAIFTDPELGGVGLTEAEARAVGFEVEVVKHPVAAVTRAQFSSSKRGLYKVVFDRATRRVLGVHVVSRGASDIVGTLALALRLGLTVDDMAAVHHVYPSYSEGLKAAAEQATKVETKGQTLRV